MDAKDSHTVEMMHFQLSRTALAQNYHAKGMMDPVALRIHLVNFENMIFLHHNCGPTPTKSTDNIIIYTIA